jgi:hypothetical protein
LLCFFFYLTDEGAHRQSIECDFSFTITCRTCSVCIYVCMYVRTYVCMYVCIYVYVCMCMYVYMYVCTYYVCVYIYLF